MADIDNGAKSAQVCTVFDRAQIKAKAAELVTGGVFIGTSSWKYEGWRGMLYDESRYVFRGKFARSRFEKNCLAEYAEVFKTVCVDGAYYKFPDEKYLTGLVSQVPSDFRFGFKVTDEITIKRFPNLPRHGDRAGKPNDHPVLEITATVEPFENGRGFSLRVLHAGKPRLKREMRCVGAPS